MIKPYHPGDEHEIVALFHTVFKKSMSSDLWLWKFKGHKAPFENVWLAKSGDRVVGHYGAIPGRIRIGDYEVRHLVGADAMVHPAFRRQGIWTGLVRHAHAYWQRAGVEIVLGLPNVQWGSRREALGWQMLFPLKYLHFPIHPKLGLPTGPNPGHLHIPAIFGDIWFRYHMGKFQTQPNFAIDLLPEPTVLLKRLWDEIKVQPFYGAIRDESWLKWRFFGPQNPHYTFLLATINNQPVGYLAYRIQETRAGRIFHIADLLAVDEWQEALTELCVHVIALARSANATSVIATSIPGSRRYSAMRRIGFLPGRHFFNVMGAPLDAEIQSSIIQNQISFHLSSGDFDIV